MTSVLQGGGFPPGLTVVSIQYRYETAAVVVAPAGRHAPKKESDRLMPSKSNPSARLRGMSFLLHMPAFATESMATLTDAPMGGFCIR